MNKLIEIVDDQVNLSKIYKVKLAEYLKTFWV